MAMYDSTLTSTRDWFDRKIDTAERSKKRLESVATWFEEVAAKAEESEIDNGFYGREINADVSIEAYFNNMGDVPTEIMDKRDWDASSVRQTDRGRYRLYLKEKV